MIVIAATLGIFHIAHQAQLILQDNTATGSDMAVLVPAMPYLVRIELHCRLWH